MVKKMDFSNTSNQELKKKLKATSYHSYLTAMAVEYELLGRTTSGDVEANRILRDHIRQEWQDKPHKEN